MTNTNQTADWRESDPGYYEMIVSEARNAKSEQPIAGCLPIPRRINRARLLDGWLR